MPLIRNLFSAGGASDFATDSSMLSGFGVLLRARLIGGGGGGGGCRGAVRTSMGCFAAEGSLLLARAFAAGGCTNASMLLGLAAIVLVSEAACFVSIFAASGAGSILGVGLVVRGADFALFVRRTAAPTALATSPASFKFRCLTPLPGAPGGPGGGGPPVVMSVGSSGTLNGTVCVGSRGF